jgi:uncharacterized protein YbjT (DUF2867 family)
MWLVTRILIIGATGNIGSRVISQLPSTGLQIRALVRNPAAARLPAHVEVIYGDLTRPATLDEGLDGIDTVFLVWVAPAEAAAAVLGQIAKRVRRIVLLSALLKTAHPLFQQPNPSRARAELLERLIETSGVEWTFLRPGMFALNALGWWAPQIRVGDVVRWPCLGVPTAPIDERDIAAVAVHTLCEDAHSGAEYVLTGPQSMTQHEQIATIGFVLAGRFASKRSRHRIGFASCRAFCHRLSRSICWTPGWRRSGNPHSLRPQSPSSPDLPHGRFPSGPRITRSSFGLDALEIGLDQLTTEVTYDECDLKTSQNRHLFRR